MFCSSTMIVGTRFCSAFSRAELNPTPQSFGLPELSLSIAFTEYSLHSSSGGGLSNDRHPPVIQSSSGDSLSNDSHPPAISKVAAVDCPTTATRPRSIINNNNPAHLHFRLKGWISTSLSLRCATTPVSSMVWRRLQFQPRALRQCPSL